MEYTKKDLVDPLDWKDVLGCVALPEEWVGDKKIFLLNVTTCRHFRKEGIRDGSCIGIDYSATFTEGKASVFGKIVKGKRQYRMSRTMMDGYLYLGQLAFIFTPVA